MRPPFDLPNVRFSQYFPNEQNLSIDESMIPLLREKFAKTTNKRNATSIWLQTVGHYHAFGICLSFGTSGQGLVFTYNMVMVTVLSLGWWVICQKVHGITSFLHFFTSLRLLKGLSDLGIAATGTIRSNGTGKMPNRYQGIEQAGAWFV